MGILIFPRGRNSFPGLCTVNPFFWACYAFLHVVQCRVIHTMQCMFNPPGFAPFINFLICAEEFRTMSQLDRDAFDKSSMVHVEHTHMYLLGWSATFCCLYVKQMRCLLTA